jgi:ubiquinone/menaquinone biosynthesis C-methylase UbiE
MSVFFHVLYQPMAWTYDWVAAIVSVGRWQSWILSVLPDIPGPRILELGHGTGHLQFALAQKGAAGFGIDLSRQMGRITQRRLSRSSFASRLVNGLAQNLPFADNSFDQVVATFPTPYIFQKQTLAEIHRVLAPAGAFVVTPEAWITGTSPLDQLAASTCRISGQSHAWEDRYLEPFLEAGFVTSTERRQLRSSELLVITAVKPPTAR